MKCWQRLSGEEARCGAAYLDNSACAEKRSLQQALFSCSMKILTFAAVFLLLTACTHAPQATDAPNATAAKVVSPLPTETHFRTLKQITFGGENAEAYFSHDGQWLTLQSTREGRKCDQQ